MYYIYFIYNSNIFSFVYYLFVAGMDFGAFVRSVPKEA